MFKSNTRSLAALALLCVFISSSASALQLDWNGQFWFDHNWLNNYQLDRSRPGYDNDPAFTDRGGTYVPGAGEKNVTWYTAFLRLKPKAVVNDSISIRSELHVGSPIYGFLGRGYPTTADEKFNFTGSQKDGMPITAQRFWANLITDFGTFDLGRAPIHWGLGAIWNSGDNLFDRYQSTGDMVRLTSKFGNFSLAPSLVKLATGTNVAGATDAAGNIVGGNDDVTDYNVDAKYDNPEEDFEFGLKWTRRTGNIAQRSIQFNSLGTGSTRLNLNVFDFYAKKKAGRFGFGAEFPYFDGAIGSIDGVNEFDYKAFAVILETTYSSDLWDIGLKAGHVPGQPPASGPSAGQPATAVGDKRFRAIYLHKNYGLGLIMFHYNIYGLANNNPDNVADAIRNSPWDEPIVNANYVALTPALKLDKWTLKAGVILGYADQTAEAGRSFYNYQNRRFYQAQQSQSRFLGKEFDLGASFKWDENFILSWDLGVWFPGDYYAFSNDPGHPNLPTDWMFASQIKAGINF